MYSITNHNNTTVYFFVRGINNLNVFFGCSSSRSNSKQRILHNRQRPITDRRHLRTTAFLFFIHIFNTIATHDFLFFFFFGNQWSSSTTHSWRAVAASFLFYAAQHKTRKPNVDASFIRNWKLGRRLQTRPEQRIHRAPGVITKAKTAASSTAFYYYYYYRYFFFSKY